MIVTLETGAAEAVLTKYRDAWLSAKRDLDRNVAENSIAKRAMPDNYWQIEHTALRRYLIAQAIIAALSEESVIDG